MANRLLRFVLAQVLLSLLLLLIWSWPQIDDAYIFLTYARHLASSGLFAFNAGEVSYGFSSPAYVLLLAATSKVTGLAVSVGMANVLGLLLCTLAALAIWLLWEELQLPLPLSNAEIVVSAILLSGPWFFTAWFFFGMETGLAVLSILGLLLALAKLRAQARTLPWLLVGIVSASTLAITRLESGIYIACAIILALFASRSRREVRDLFLIGLSSGAVEIGWLFYAKRTFGTYMPWSSTARLLYYLPTAYTHIVAERFNHLSPIARTLFAIKAASHMLFDGPLKILLLALPLAAATFFARAKSTPDTLKWMLRVAIFGFVLQIVTFSYLFPLAQNRHFAPYLACLWVLVVPLIVRSAKRASPFVQNALVLALVALWIGGAIQYRFSGAKLGPLHQLAARNLLSTDRVAAEPIGILAFESPAHIIDLGGLTDRDAWPMLEKFGNSQLSEVIAWDLSKGATKLVLKAEQCGESGQIFGHYCLIGASDAQSLVHDSNRSKSITTQPPAPER
jgi:hypothetical protein